LFIPVTIATTSLPCLLPTAVFEIFSQVGRWTDEQMVRRAIVHVVVIVIGADSRLCALTMTKTTITTTAMTAAAMVLLPVVVVVLTDCWLCALTKKHA